MSVNAPSRWTPAIGTCLLALTVGALGSCDGPSAVSPTNAATQDRRAERGDNELIEFDAPGSAQVASPACGGTCGTQALANNAEGAVAGSFTDAKVVSHGFLRSPDGRITSFDAPGAGSVPNLDQGTFVFSINDLGAIAGAVQDAGNAFRGFVRHPDGSFTTFNVPGAGTGAFQGTLVFSNNWEGATAGSYIDGSGTEHGFVRSRDGKVTSFDPTGATFTMVCEETCINPEGAVTGFWGDAGGAFHGFLREPGGKITTIDAPGSAGFTVSASINPEGTTAGYSVDASNVAHGFIRSRHGAFTTIDVPGASVTPGNGTVVFSINLFGAVTGEFNDANGVFHGFSRSVDGTFTKFDARGAGTQINQGTRPSTNNLEGAVTGWWVAGNNVNHGFVWSPGDGDRHRDE